MAEAGWGDMENLRVFEGRTPRIHDLRHTYASHFMMSGGNILALQKLLGHHDIKLTQKYAHLAPDHLAAEAARVSFRPKPRKEGKVFALGDVK